MDALRPLRLVGIDCANCGMRFQMPPTRATQRCRLTVEQARAA